MFVEWTQSHRLHDCLLSIDEYHPCPAARERKDWDSLPTATRDRLIAQAETRLGFDYPTLSATAFMEYVRSGDREIYEIPYYERRYALTDLILGECAEGRGRFVDDIVNGVWAICEESFWGISAHNGLRHDSGIPLPDTENHIIDLFAAETAGLLSWCVYLLGDQLDSVTPLIRRRIDRELEARIRLPFLYREDFWWMGFGRVTVNNWNPWIMANLLTVFLLTDRDEYRRCEAVYKIFECLDNYIATVGDDGGCDEGTTYWSYAGGTLFDCVEQLYTASDGRIDLFGEPKIREIGLFPCRCHIDGDRFVNFADGGARVELPRGLLWRYGKRIGDERLCKLASSLPEGELPPDIPRPLRRLLPDLFCERELAAKTVPPYIRDAWLESVQVMTARESEGSPRGLFLAAKGGNNGESHNHNDIGSFILYRDGQPVLIDVGVETYTRQTFGEDRYKLWTMQSSYHNLPELNNTMQLPGSDRRAANVSYNCNDELVEFSLDLAGAYPSESQLEQYRRKFVFLRGSEPSVTLCDSYQFTRQDGKHMNSLKLNLMTACRPVTSKDGHLLLPYNDRDAVRLEYPEPNEMSIEEIAIHDEKLGRVWGSAVYRIILTYRVKDNGAITLTMR